jgi:hypothetical protein
MITQQQVTDAFIVRLGNNGLFYDLEDAAFVKKTIAKLFKIEVSIAEAIDYWYWYSEQLDASWLNTSLKDEYTIADYFPKFCNKFYPIESEET